MATENENSKGDCFVIMPISDPEGYPEDHFRKVYEQLFKPAISNAGYNPVRVDEVTSSTLIQARILNQLVTAPMVLCDLSTRNPNVLFELGLRQAFDKPVALVQECGTERIFDISNITTLDYRSERLYDQVLEDQGKITDCILQTEKESAFNSLISYLKITKAPFDNSPMPENEASQMMLRSIMNELSNIKSDINNLQRNSQSKYYKSNDNYYDYKTDPNSWFLNIGVSAKPTCLQAAP